MIILMGEGAWLIGFLVVQRLAELGLAQWNTVRLRARGGVEFGARIIRSMVALHAFWLLGLWMFGHERASIRSGSQFSSCCRRAGCG